MKRSMIWAFLFLAVVLGVTTELVYKAAKEKAKQLKGKVEISLKATNDSTVIAGSGQIDTGVTRYYTGTFYIRNVNGYIMYDPEDLAKLLQYSDSVAKYINKMK